MSDATVSSSASSRTSPPLRRLLVPAALVALALSMSTAVGRWSEVSNLDAVANGAQPTMQGPLMLGLFAFMLPIVVLIVYGAQLGSAIAVDRARRDAERERPTSWWPAVAGAIGPVVLVLVAIVADVIALGWALMDAVLGQVFPAAYRDGPDRWGLYGGAAVMLLVCGFVAALPSTAIATAVARHRLGISGS